MSLQFHAFAKIIGTDRRKSLGRFKVRIRIHNFLASLRKSPKRFSKWGMGCPFLEIKKGRKYGCTVQWQKYALIYVVIYCQDSLGLTLKMQ